MQCFFRHAAQLGTPLVFALGLVMGGCTTVPLISFPSGPVVSHFELSGRLSVREAQRGEIATLHWKRSAAGEDIKVLSPLGQVVATLSSRRAGLASLTTSQGRRTAASLEELTGEALGTSVPVTALATWVQGWSSGEGKMSRQQFVHQGWQVELDRVELFGGQAIARRLTAIKGDTVIKLFVDEWKSLP